MHAPAPAAYMYAPAPAADIYVPAPAAGVPSSWPPHFQSSVDEAWRETRDFSVSTASWRVPFGPHTSSHVLPRLPARDMYAPAPAAGVPSSWPPDFQSSVDEAWRETREDTVSTASWRVPFDTSSHVLPRLPARDIYAPAPAAGVPSSWPPHSQSSVDEAWRETRDGAVSTAAFPVWRPTQSGGSGRQQTRLDPGAVYFLQVGSTALLLRAGGLSMTADTWCPGRYHAAGLDVWQRASAISVETRKEDARQPYKSDHGKFVGNVCR